MAQHWVIFGGFIVRARMRSWSERADEDRGFYATHDVFGRSATRKKNLMCNLHVPLHISLRDHVGLD